ncbi:hypothetical protein [Entomomonas asaccharolytica]|uniref:Uncharacterized protein n=1 Tax=Entomomonas asaccharolytica TaxID=2785331 RepID=A0A974RWM3_9GAMM|nr:hypothetical protein [Entomomonas asaccharolytica]QQP85325.1 hypothetical protein JHT90_13215 [Entomomonas asaccharolytica]
MFMGGSIFAAIGIIMCIYACIKDIQASKIIWAILDILFFPVGVIRCIMHLLS